MSLHDKILSTWLYFWNVWLHECICTFCGYNNVNHYYTFAADHVDVQRFFTIVLHWKLTSEVVEVVVVVEVWWRGEPMI